MLVLSHTRELSLVNFHKRGSLEVIWSCFEGDGETELVDGWMEFMRHVSNDLGSEERTLLGLGCEESALRGDFSRVAAQNVPH